MNLSERVGCECGCEYECAGNPLDESDGKERERRRWSKMDEVGQADWLLWLVDRGGCFYLEW